MYVCMCVCMCVCVCVCALCDLCTFVFFLASKIASYKETHVKQHMQSLFAAHSLLQLDVGVIERTLYHTHVTSATIENNGVVGCMAKYLKKYIVHL